MAFNKAWDERDFETMFLLTRLGFILLHLRNLDWVKDFLRRDSARAANGAHGTDLKHVYSVINPKVDMIVKTPLYTHSKTH